MRDIRRYIRLGPLGRAFGAEQRQVLLIDEVDKADIEFPNDLLQELDEMSFHILETDETVAAVQRPVVVITSNAEKELPDAFLRRCVFHYIDFPDAEQMRAIVEVHYPNLDQRLLADALEAFYGLREVPGLRKKPSTSELLDWLRVLLASGARLSPGEEGAAEVPFLGTLIKLQEDADAVTRGDARGLDGRTAGRRFIR